MGMSKKTKKSKTVRLTLNEAVKQSKTLKKGEKTAAELKHLQDAEIDYSDIPELTQEFWRNARMLRPAHKTPLTLRLDDDVITWFKSLGKGYQSEMNAVLKAFVETQKCREGKHSGH